MFRDRLHTKPFITAGVLMLAGIILVILGFSGSGDADMNQYALAAFGLMLFIAGAVTFVMYGALEKRYGRLLREKPLLRYTLHGDMQKAQAEKNINELKAKNKALLTIMLFFCGLFAVILPFFVEEKLVMILICLGLGVFLSLAAWVITAYRVRKMRAGGEEVILGRGGAYVAGAFHAWDMPETFISDLSWQPPEVQGEMGRLKIEYTALSIPAPLTESITLLVPPEMEADIPGALAALEERRAPRGKDKGIKVV